MSDALVLRDDANGVATLTLNRPGKLNALTPALFAELRAHVDAIAESEDTGAVVLAGAGRSFCAGNDLTAIAQRDPDTRPTLEAETIDAIEALPMPVIGRIQGHCITGGLELALGCDMLVAAESASFRDTHGVWGMAPVWGMSVRLPERVGPVRAKEIMFTGRPVSGAEAVEIGLAVRCVPDAELDAAVAELSAAIVANSWGTNRIDKALLADAARRDRRAALDHERTRPYGFPPDMQERVARFAKRG